MPKKKPPVHKQALPWTETTQGRTFAFASKSGLDIRVTRHKDYPPDVWLLLWHGGYTPLTAKEIEKAKEQAISLVRTWLTTQLRDLTP